MSLSVFPHILYGVPTYVCMYTYVRRCIYIFTISVCTYVCMYVYMHTYVCSPVYCYCTCLPSSKICSSHPRIRLMLEMRSRGRWKGHLSVLLSDQVIVCMYSASCCAVIVCMYTVVFLNGSVFYLHTYVHTYVCTLFTRCYHLCVLRTYVRMYVQVQIPNLYRMHVRIYVRTYVHTFVYLYTLL